MKIDVECTCTPLPGAEGPCAWCDIHGQPSVAWDQGVAQGRHERISIECAATEPARARITRMASELLVDRPAPHEYRALRELDAQAPRSTIAERVALAMRIPIAANFDAEEGNANPRYQVKNKHGGAE